jgi:hypothetical protein
MQIDRKSFLILASALATGCAPRHQGETAPVVSEGTPPPPASAAPPATVEPVPTVGEPAKGQWPTPSAESIPPPTGEGYWPTPAGEGGYVPPTPTPKPFNASACSGDDTGTPGSCAGLKFDKSCNPFPFVTDACNDAIKYYKPRIAERAVGCIRKLAPKPLCDAMTTYHCKDDALRAACVDSSADASCLQILTVCKGTSMKECRGYLSGMNDVGRAAMVKCMSNKSYCGFGLYSCTESL